MEMRRCVHTHFVKDLRRGLVGKVQYTNDNGRPSLSCEGIDAEAIPIVSSCKMQAGLPIVDTTLHAIKTQKDEFDPHSDGSASDLDDNTTIRQFKNRSCGKKRRFSHGDDNPVEYISQLDPLREIKSEKDENVPSSDNSLDSDDGITLTQLRVRFHEKKRKLCGGEDESNLDEPIISLKSKNSKKSSPSTSPFNNIKCEPDLVSEGSQQVGCDFAPRVKSEESESPIKTSFDNEASCPADEVSEGSHQVGCDFAPRNGVKLEESESPRKSPFDNEASCPADEVNTGIEFDKPQVSPEECRICVTNMISYEHLDDFEPTSEFVPSEMMNENLETWDELCCHEVLGEMSEQSCSSGVHDLDMATDCTTGCIGEFVDNFKSGLSHVHDNSLSSPNLNCGSSQESVTSLKIDDDSLAPIIITNKVHSVTRSSLDDITESGVDSKTNINDELLKTNAESRDSPEKQMFGCAHISQPPERLLSTRKLISPSSQEQLCSAMNSVDMVNDINKYVGSERRWKHYESETCKKAPSTRKDIRQANIDANHGRHDKQFSQKKVNIICSRHNYKKYQDSKVNLEGPRFSRILPNLSTECTSIQSCSERAIAFSQRQMQDTESLAFKLMDELESLKSMVEQKLLFEVYRNVPLKPDADEVSSAIKSATKLDERARKWLSTMFRDCNRFCKIMKLTPNASPASNDIPRENRKIIFADEAGGKLCHVKYFEAVATPPAADCVKQ